MSEARRKAPHSADVIERWVNEYAREQGMVVGRLQRWGIVPFEVASAEGEAGDDVEMLDAIAIEQFGLDGPTRVPCLGVRYQVAQKIHACTELPP